MMLLAALAGGAVWACVVLLGSTPGSSRAASMSFAPALAVSGIIVVACAIRLRHHDRIVARWVLAIGCCVLGYLYGLAAALLLRESDAPLTVTSWVTNTALAGYVWPLLLLQLTLLAAGDRLLGRPVGRTWPLVFLAIGAISYLFLLTVPGEEPPSDVPPPVVDGWLAAAGATWLQGVSALTFVASVFVAPVVLWRRVPRLDGPDRQRLAPVAASALVPMVVIGVCFVLLPALSAAGLPDSAGTTVLGFAFGASCALTALALVRSLSLSERDESPPAAVPLGATVTLLLVLVTVALSAAASVLIAPGSVVFAVLVTVVLVAVAAAVRAVVLRRLLRYADPPAARAAHLLRTAASADRVRTHPGATARLILRESLAEPDLDLLLRLPDGAGWADAVGGPPPPRDGRTETDLVPDDLGPSVRVLHRVHPADLTGPARELAALLDRAVLECAVRHHTALAGAQRARAERAATQERERLQRDLHDGVQGRLIAVAMGLQETREGTGDAVTDLRLGEAVESLRDAIVDVRRLASGEVPGALADGLAPALADLASRVPVPITLDVAQGRLPARVEHTAYLVVSEAVTNLLKHAAAGSASVTVRPAGGDDPPAGVLHVRVVDDGRGGADLRAGSGLRGLSERVGTVGGTLVVSDREGGGTVVEAVLPCGE